MKEINNYDELCGIVTDIMSNGHQEKPALIWFSGDVARSNMLIDRFNKEFINLRFEEIQKENLGGVIKKTNKKAIVFHRYVNQMDESFLRGIVETKRLSKKPVFVLANSYEQPNKPNWVDDIFEQVIYNTALRVVLVSCSSKKKIINQDTRIQAEDLYVSPLFISAWAYSSTMVVDKRFIISDKYGLLEPTDLIQSYNESLKNLTPVQRRQWAEGVVKKLTSKGFCPNMDEFILLTGRLYLQVLSATGAFTNIHSLYQDNRLRGIGYILQFLK